MKKTIQTIAITLAALLGASTTELKAQETAISLETDPATFALKGYAAHIRIQPKGSKHWVLGAGTYALDIPDLMVNMNEANKNKGWNVRINSAYSVFGEYYFKEANRNWFVGLQTGVQRFKITNDNSESEGSKYKNLLAMPSVGYNWRPFKFPMYLKPWLGIGYTSKISGSNTIDAQSYDISSLIPFATLHIGYTFSQKAK